MMQRYIDIENEYGELFHMINSLAFLPALSYLFLQAMISSPGTKVHWAKIMLVIDTYFVIYVFLQFRFGGDFFPKS